MKNYNWVKISHSGKSILKLKEIKPRIFKIEDVSVYFDENTFCEISVDFEKKILGLEKFVWKFLLFILLTAIFQFIIIWKLVNRILPKNKMKKPKIA